MKKVIVVIGLLCVACNINAQTCNANMTKNAPDSRYNNNSDGTIYDKKTTLTWMRCPIGQTWESGDDSCSGSRSTISWDEALQTVSVQNSNFLLGKNNWRLPNIKELKSLIELACYEPAMNETLFPGTTSRYLSSSVSPYNSYKVWTVNFANGKATGSFSGRNHADGVRLVRGGQ